MMCAMTVEPVLADTQRRFVMAARRAILATTDPDGRARLVPIGFVLEAVAPVLWSSLDEKPKASSDPRGLARVRDILARPRVSILVDRWDEDWSRLGWVRIYGHAELVEPGVDGHAEAVTGLRARYPQYADHDPQDATDAARHDRSRDRLGRPRDLGANRHGAWRARRSVGA